MSTTAFSEIYDVMRVILGDDAALGDPTYTDDQLAAAITSVFRMGQHPEGYTADSQAATISPALPDGTAFAAVTLRACQLRLGGKPGAYSYRTRALSVTLRGTDKKQLLDWIAYELYRLVDGVVAYASKADYVSYLYTLRGGSPAVAHAKADVRGAGEVVRIDLTD